MKKNNTNIIYLTGKPGVGKYTIAKELAANHGFIVCDNQLINNPIFELLQYDGYDLLKAEESFFKSLMNTCAAFYNNK